MQNGFSMNEAGEGGGQSGEAVKLFGLQVNGAGTEYSAATHTVDVEDQSRHRLIAAYRTRGHFLANLDPLLPKDPTQYPDPELDPSTYGATLGDDGPKVVADLRKAYCGEIGWEYMHIQAAQERRWLQLRIESETDCRLTKESRVCILGSLIAAEEFERFLHARHVGKKRFSLEGGETAVAILTQILERASDNNVSDVVIGMPHRGRLNILANVVGKDLKQIFAEFEDKIDLDRSGDVKYHLGYIGVVKGKNGKETTVLVAPNPSHLEAVDPVVEGMVRAKQDLLGDTSRERVIPLLIHGDAAFAGQGVVAETLNLSQLDGYSTGGTIHLVINNQIGFTTLPVEARSTHYCTDVARALNVPIFHVNGDDADAATRVAQIAFDYRQQFEKDVVIDMICYRRNGHNETEDPGDTLPVLYRKIKKHPPVAKLYADRLIREGMLGDEEVQSLHKASAKRFSDAYETSSPRFERSQICEPGDGAHDMVCEFCPCTAASHATIEKVILAVTTLPESFHLHHRPNRVLDRRREVVQKNSAIDWALGETLAFATLAIEGTPVRLSGQDCRRGTFSQRHLAVYHLETGHRHIPMQSLSRDQGRFDAFDSPLAEYAVLGFEYGYSVADPLTLVIWEAQFADFANGAQIIVDNFITAAESKWGQQSSLVMLLPHGYEGQGPEHSSARVERYLALSAENNWIVANCTMPSQFFHLLRRQMCGDRVRQGKRKPLVVFTPKSLRHPRAVSPIGDFTSGGFEEILDDSSVTDKGSVSRIVFCSGKLYYDLLSGREHRNAANVALVRVEQLYPFEADRARDILHRYQATAEVVWAQEEPRNMGPWCFMREHLEPLLKTTQRALRYVGRPESASPATGSARRHQREQDEIVTAALSFGSVG
jgi:multifunctional 2-oxoglutarate metabolism enzyme